MLAWNLSVASIEALLQLAETGMGFQLVAAQSHGESSRFVVFNSEVAFDVSDLDLLAGDDPSVILANGIRVLEAIRRAGAGPAIIGRPEPHSFVLVGSRIGALLAPPGGSSGPASGAQVAQSSSLVKSVVLSSERVFHRFSAFNPDRRVDPITGDFAPGTYAAPESEVPFIPTGFAAVGRFALPNVLPASYHYVIEAPARTGVEFGTVAPAFGQAGGGVEAYFADAVVNVQNPRTPPSRIPDE